MIVSAGGVPCPTYALLDTGANTSAITDDLALKINAPLETINIQLNTFGQTSLAPREVASFKVSNLLETFEISVDNALVGNLLSTESERPSRAADLTQFEHLKDIVFNELEDDKVGLLLDAKYAKAFMTGRVYAGKDDEPLCIETKFGPAIMGPKFEENVVVNNDICTLDVQSDALADDMRKIFRTDFIMQESQRFPAEMTHMSANDEWSLEQLKETLKFNQDSGHYSTGLPWRLGREETAELFKTIDFYSTAHSRHEKLKKKFERNPWLKEGSFKQMDEKLSKGYVRKIESTDAPNGSPECYLPVHVALHPEKPLKFRLCLDAAAKTGPHFLNKWLLNGPDFLNKLIGILTRFRQKKYTLTGDIKDFFYQIEVDPADRPALRFLWWADQNMDQTILLEALVHIFGGTSSPAVANFVLRHHAEEIKDKYPLIVYEAIMRAFYVDDLISSQDTEEETFVLKENLEKALKEGGFTILKWQSNIPGISDDTETLTTPSSSSIPSQMAPSRSEDTKIADQSPAASGETAVKQAVAVGENHDVNGGRRQTGPATLPGLGSVPPTTPEDEEKETGRDLPEVSSLSNSWECELLKELLQEAPEKVLGVGYDYSSDMLNVRVREKQFKSVRTKSEVLSFIASVYDPLGIVSPYILKGRMYFQMINETDISWNDPVPEHILTPFLKWKDTIVHLRKIKIPRWTNPLGLADCQSDLIIFCDASSVGYGYCAYVRRALQGGSDRCSVSFLFGKAHVVPVNMMKNQTEHALSPGDSIPRLELNAARGAAECRDLLLRESGESYDNVFLFSDSLTVLGWLFNFEKRFKTYENFRVKAIRSLSQLSEWRHVPTQLNPADLCSKSIEANDTKKWEFYHNGPQFLLSPFSEWPPVRPVNSPCPEVTIGAISWEDPEEIISPAELLMVGATAEEANVAVDHHDDEPWPLKVSKREERWDKKIRKVAMVRRVLLTLKERVYRKKNNLTETRLRSKEKRKTILFVFSEEEKQKAESLLVSAIQNVNFEKETVSLIKHGVFTPNALFEMKVKGSALSHLSPFLDSENVMRVSGRCRKGDHLSYESRFPIILPNHKDENTCSLIRHYHERNMHTTKLQTYYLLREKFFILGGKNSVSFVLNRCMNCQRLTKLPAAQREGDLPKERIDTVAPFTNSGIDCFGPYYLRHTGRGTMKRFVLLVCCMSTRAVSLHPLRDMTTSAVINALMRMNAQFPGVKKLFSDQGSNFKGADREIREAILKWNKDELNLQLEKVGLSWVFGPARCGSAGGAWERLVGMTKRLIRSVLGNKTIDSDDFDTLIAGAAAIMNRRPLMQVSADPNDPLVLSPTHFLYPHVFTNSSTSIIPPNSGDPDGLRRGWKATQALLDDFFRRYKEEYLASLLKRKKTDSVAAPKIGDIVLLADDQLAREDWNLCRVVDVINEDQDHGRRFLVRDSRNKIFDRDIHSVIPLEL